MKDAFGQAKVWSVVHLAADVDDARIAGGRKGLDDTLSMRDSFW